MDFLKIWEIILRRKWIIIGVLFCFFITVIIGSLLIPKTYEAKTKILFEPTDALSNLNSTLGLVTEQARDDDYTFETEIELAKVRPLLEQLISSLQLKDRKGKTIDVDDFIKSSLLNPLSKISPQPYIEVNQYEDADILEVISTSPDPVEAASIAEKFTEIYIKAAIDRTREDYKTARIFIEKQIQKVKQDYYESLSDIKNYRIQEGTIDLTSEIGKLIDKIAELKDDYEKNEITIYSLDVDIEQIKEQLENRKEFRKDSEEFVLNDQLKTLKSEVNEYLITIAATEIELRKDHPDYRQLEKKLNMAKKLLKNETNLVLNSEKFSVDPIFQTLTQNLIDNYMSKETAIAKRKIWQSYIDIYQDELIKIPIKLEQISILNSKSTVAKEKFEKLLGYLVNAGIAESITLGNIRLIEPAKIPEKPDFPKKFITLILAIFPGLFWAFGLAFFIEYIDISIKGPEDLKNVNPLNFLGNIPYNKSLKNKKTISNLIPTAPAVEAFRMLRNNIRYISFDVPLNTIMVTSSIDNEGKTSVASNIAITLSIEGKKVILIDLDFKKPTVHRYFGITNEKGISDILTQKIEIEEGIVTTNIDGLSVIPSGLMPFETTKLIDPAQVRMLIDSLRERYDMIVVDTCSILPVNDPISIGTIMDGVIWVIEPGKITIPLIEQSKNFMERAHVKLIGVLFNKTKTYHFLSPVLSIKSVLSKMMNIFTSSSKC